VELTVVRKW